jgi:hypothetical protein
MGLMPIGSAGLPGLAIRSMLSAARTPFEGFAKAISSTATIGAATGRGPPLIYFASELMLEAVIHTV